DLLVGGFDDINRIWLNNGQGVFEASDIAFGRPDVDGSRCSKLALGDMDQDGDTDVVCSTHNDELEVWLNE
ncbi:MAG: FG-GAP-like repeat-containing protein, partial [Myxococcota bacterium]